MSGKATCYAVKWFSFFYWPTWFQGHEPGYKSSNGRFCTHILWLQNPSWPQSSWHSLKTMPKKIGCHDSCPRSSWHAKSMPEFQAKHLDPPVPLIQACDHLNLILHREGRQGLPRSLPFPFTKGFWSYMEYGNVTILGV